MKGAILATMFVILANTLVASGQCPDNEEPSDCGANECQNTCTTPNLSDTCKGSCTAGCVCSAGYVRNAEGTCVLQNECPPTECPEDPNAVMVPCGDPCPITCENKDSKEPTACITLCIVNGCKCNYGYVIGSNGKCILASRCPNKKPIRCRINEEYSECGANGCQNTCDNPTFGQVCRGLCVEGCICKEGFVRNDNGRCVPLEYCVSSRLEKS